VSSLDICHITCTSSWCIQYVVSSFSFFHSLEANCLTCRAVMHALLRVYHQHPDTYPLIYGWKRRCLLKDKAGEHRKYGLVNSMCSVVSCSESDAIWIACFCWCSFCYLGFPNCSNTLRKSCRCFVWPLELIPTTAVVTKGALDVLSDILSIIVDINCVLDPICSHSLAATLLLSPSTVLLVI